MSAYERPIFALVVAGSGSLSPEAILALFPFVDRILLVGEGPSPTLMAMAQAQAAVPMHMYREPWGNDLISATNAGIQHARAIDPDARVLLLFAEETIEESASLRPALHALDAAPHIQPGQALALRIVSTADGREESVVPRIWKLSENLSASPEGLVDLNGKPITEDHWSLLPGAQIVTPAPLTVGRQREVRLPNVPALFQQLQHEPLNPLVWGRIVTAGVEGLVQTVQAVVDGYPIAADSLAPLVPQLQKLTEAKLAPPGGAVLARTLAGMSGTLAPMGVIAARVGSQSKSTGTLRGSKAPRVLLLADVRGWGFDINNDGIAATLEAQGWEVDRFYVGENTSGTPPLDYDLYYTPYQRWPLLAKLPRHRLLGSLRSQWFRPEEPGPPTEEDVELVRSFPAGFHVCNQPLEDAMAAAGCPVEYLTNPVSMEWLGVPTQVEGVVASWSGNAKRGFEGDLKGFGLIQEACKLAEVPLEYAEFHTKRLLPAEMPDFYRRGSVVLSASLSEGASNSVMEAMGAGQALITTDCGNIREIMQSQLDHFGATGIMLVERTVEAFAQALGDLKEAPEVVAAMGELNRREIRARWSWDFWGPAYLDFFRAGLEHAEARVHLLYADTPNWAQDHFVRDLGEQLSSWGHEPHVINGDLTGGRPHEGSFYSPCAGAANSMNSPRASTGLWSHVSYGGWFSDEPLDSLTFPHARCHATNLYLHAHSGLPYLASGVDLNRFHPGDRVSRKRNDPRIVVGWTGSLEYNAAVKLFRDLWLPALKLAGADGPLAEARFAARPLVVWNSQDARSPEQVAEYLRGIDIYLCTSISEGCSLSVLEAAASGCVVLSTPCGNAPELATAIVPWSATGIADVLTEYADPDKLLDAAERSYERVERYWSWDSPIKRASWEAWLAGEDPPSWQEQVPYLAETNLHDLLEESRNFRQEAAPPLKRGDMYRS